MEFTRIPGETGPETLYRQIGRAIVLGDFDVTGFPSEQELALLYSATATHVHKAINILIFKGLIRRRPRRGLYIEAEQNWKLLDSDISRWISERVNTTVLTGDYECLHLALSPIAADLSAKQPSNRAHRRLLGYASQMTERFRNAPAYRKLKGDFHAALFESTKHSIISQLSEANRTAAMHYDNNKSTDNQTDAAWHKQLAEAIFSHDSILAQKMIRLIAHERMNTPHMTVIQSITPANIGAPI